MKLLDQLTQRGLLKSAQFVVDVLEVKNYKTTFNMDLLHFVQKEYGQVQDEFLSNYALILQGKGKDIEQPSDAFDYYLKALYSTSQDKNIEYLLEALNQEPLLWCAYQLLGQECKNWEKLESCLQVDNWMSQMAILYCATELYGPQQDGHRYDTTGLHQILDELKEQFPRCHWLDYQRANLFYHMRSFEECAELFKWLCEVEPNNLQYVPMYSNVLFVQDDAATLSQLCQHLVQQDPKCYWMETCYVLGNYYSLKTQKQEAIKMFQRCVKLGGDRNQLVASAYTLMGHEYIECGNTDAALEAYRSAIKISSSDYRAWYGLGQTYEMLSMPLYSLYYFQKATKLRPQDSRMWMALANVHELCEDEDKAVDAYLQALLVGSMVELQNGELTKVQQQDDDQTWQQTELQALHKLFTITKNVSYAKLLVQALQECETFSSRTGIPMDVPELEYAYVVQAVIDDCYDCGLQKEVPKLKKMLANFANQEK